MKLLLVNASGDGSLRNTPFGVVEDGETAAIVDPSTANFLLVKSVLDAIADFSYRILEGAGTASWTSTSVTLVASQTFTLSGVDTHSVAQANFGGNLPAGCVVGVQCTATDTVVVTVANLSGTPATVPDTTLDIVWTNPAAF